MKTYDIFISRSWSDSDNCERLMGLLQNRPYFRFNYYSVSRYRPITSPNASALTAAVINQIKQSKVILVAAGVDAAHHKWRLKEMIIAKAEGRFILGIRPYGNRDISEEVRKRADNIVGWNSKTIIRAIKDLSNLPTPRKYE